MVICFRQVFIFYSNFKSKFPKKKKLEKERKEVKKAGKIFKIKNLP